PRREDAAADRNPRIPLGAAPGGEHEAATRSQDAARRRKGGLGIAHEHEDEPANDAVDGVVLELEVLGVHRAVFDVQQAELSSAPAWALGRFVQDTRDVKAPLL